MYFCHKSESKLNSLKIKLMRNLVFIASLTFLMCWNSFKVNGQVNGIRPKNVPFYSEFIDSVPELKVPQEGSCGFEKLILNEVQREKLKPFTPAGYEIIGKFSINSKFNILLCGELIDRTYIPYLFITDKEGMGASNQKLLENLCSLDTNFYFTYTIAPIAFNQILVTQTKIFKDPKLPTNQAIKYVYEINWKGEIRKF
jgi:hypothetical protein